MGQAPMLSAAISAHLTSSYTNTSIVIDRDEDKMLQSFQRRRRGDSPGIYSCYRAGKNMQGYISVCVCVIQISDILLILDHLEERIVVMHLQCEIRFSPVSLDSLRSKLSTTVYSPFIIQIKNSYKHPESPMT